MIGDIPIVSFDTSSHNRLVKDGSLSEPILAGLKSGFAFRFVGLSIDEMVATADPVKRSALFAYCSRIQDGVSECIYPHNELVKRMIVGYSKNPTAFEQTYWEINSVKIYQTGVAAKTVVSTLQSTSCTQAPATQAGTEASATQADNTARVSAASTSAEASAAAVTAGVLSLSRPTAIAG